LFHDEASSTYIIKISDIQKNDAGEVLVSSESLNQTIVRSEGQSVDEKTRRENNVLLPTGEAKISLIFKDPP
jgi:hypothetical protein